MCLQAIIQPGGSWVSRGFPGELRVCGKLQPGQEGAQLHSGAWLPSPPRLEEDGSRGGRDHSGNWHLLSLPVYCRNPHYLYKLLFWTDETSRECPWVEHNRLHFQVCLCLQSRPWPLICWHRDQQVGAQDTSLLQVLLYSGSVWWSCWLLLTQALSTQQTNASGYDLIFSFQRRILALERCLITNT